MRERYGDMNVTIGLCRRCGANPQTTACPSTCTPLIGVRDVAQVYGWANPVPCEHCFCVRAAEEGTAVSFCAVGPHRQCCKCWTVMAEEFVKP